MRLDGRSDYREKRQRTAALQNLRSSARAAELRNVLECGSPLPLSVRGAGGLKTFGPASRGFTLIELMIVVVLMGILAAMIIPEMKGSFEDALLRSAARKLVSAFNLAHSSAITQSQVCRVRFDKKTARYFIERPSREGESTSGFVAVDGSAGAGQFDARISLEIQKAAEESPDRKESSSEGRAPASLSRDTVSFYPDGTADSAELMLRDREGFRLVLRINPITGRVEVLEAERK